MAGALDGMVGQLADSNESKMRDRDRARVAPGRASRRRRYARGGYGQDSSGQRDNGHGGQTGSQLRDRRKGNPSTHDNP
jgi:hypothetical protein